MFSAPPVKGPCATSQTILAIDLGGSEVRLLPKLKIAQKLPLALMISAILVSAGVGAASYLIASRSLETEARQNLSTIAFDRARQLATYLKTVETDLVKSSQSDNTIDALSGFTAAWKSIDTGTPEAALQKAYITDNPNPAAKRMMLDQGDAATGYMITHMRFQPIFRSQILRAGYRDLYLFDTAGNLVYSTAKQADFATNFAKGGGPYATTNLADAYRRAMKIGSPNAFVFSDFSNYPAMPGTALSFFAKPVFARNGDKLGVIAFALPADKFASVIGYTDGLGRTGDATIVGSDGRARNDSGLTTQNDVLKPTIFDATIKHAVAGVRGTSEVADFRGARVLEAAAPVDITPTQSWALVATQDVSEIFAPVRHLGTTMLAIGLALLLVVALAGLFFARSITKPISALTATMAALADGDFAVELKGADGHDELGAMARAVEVFRENGLKVAQLTEDERLGVETRQRERTRMMADLQRAFGAVVEAAIDGDFSRRVEASFPDPELNELAGAINTLVETVDTGLSETGSVLGALADTDLTRRMTGEYAGAFGQLRDDTNAVGEKLTEIVSQLRTTSKRLKSATEEILAGSNDLSERTSRQAATIEETSAAMEQLAATVVDNAQRAEDASLKACAVSQTAEEGGTVMEAASQAMARITASSGKISSIMSLIDDIAFQTNLLALNASVEAARAGEAGKGFAVVAVEVRRLAQSAAEASKEIKALIEASAGEVSGGANLVSQAAAKLVAMREAARDSSALIGGIATASKEQASAIEEVGSAVRQLDEMTQHNAALVEETNAALEQTEAQASELDRIVDVFTIESTPATHELEPEHFSRPVARRTYAA